MERPADGAPKSIGVALYNYVAQSDNQLSLTKDEKITILKKLDSGWCLGENASGKLGHFPASYVREVADDIEKPPIIRSQSSDVVTSQFVLAFFLFHLFYVRQLTNISNSIRLAALAPCRHCL
jgi:hypothetical protein